MPYPFDNPTAKHDLLQKSEFASCKSLLDTCGFSNIDSLLDSLEHEPPPTNVVRIGSIYSYKDSPSQPLSRSLCIVGVIDALHSELGKLISDDSSVPTFLHSCTIAVKRADGEHANRLKPEEITNSHGFANFLRKLKNEGVMAILGKDKYNRFAILVPPDDMVLDDDYDAQDFSATCYVGTIDSVRDNITNIVARPKRPLASVSNQAGDGVWQPPDANTDCWQPPETSPETAFQFSSNENSTWQSSEISATNYSQGSKESTFHADAGAAAADRFYSGLTRTLDTRAESRLYHMRAFNGWVKATQVQELDPKTSSKKPNSPLRVLDLACGKGGDLGKWVLHPRGIQNYVGIDVARGSLVDAAIRARKMRQKLKRCTFTCADLGADVPGRLKTPKHKHMQKLSTWSLDRDNDNAHSDPEFKLLRGGGVAKDDKFDVVSIQFAIHYMMETKKRALRFFQTVSELLDIGGNLIVTTIDARIIVRHLMDMGLNLHFDDDDEEPIVIAVGAGACRIKFEPHIVKQIFETKWTNHDDVSPNLFGLQYSFTLVEGSDHASGIGDAVDLPEWLIPIPVLQALGRQAGLEIEYAQNFHEFFEHRSDPSAHAAAHTSMYNMKVLNRNGSISEDEFEISGLYIALKFRKIGESKIQINDNDDDVTSDDEEDLTDVDPKVKSKLFPMALLKAKNSVGADTWAVLSSEEKTSLTEIELRKLLLKS